MRFVYVIPVGGFPLKAAIETQDANPLVLESFWYIKNREFHKTAAYYQDGIAGLRAVSRKVPRRLKGLI